MVGSLYISIPTAAHLSHSPMGVDPQHSHVLHLNRASATLLESPFPFYFLVCSNEETSAYRPFEPRRSYVPSLF